MSAGTQAARHFHVARAANISFGSSGCAHLVVVVLKLLATAARLRHLLLIQLLEAAADALPIGVHRARLQGLVL